MIHVDEPTPPAPMFDGTQPCTTVDPDLWFPSTGGSYGVAKTVCMGCPFQIPCLEWGVKHEQFGMWGGASPVELGRIRKARGLVLEDLTPPLREEVNGVVSYASGPTHGTVGGVRWHHRHKVPTCDSCKSYLREHRALRRRPITGPDDPRHGKAEGYRAGCRETDCRNAMAAQRKAKGY